MKNFSRFDIAMVIAFVIVAALGAGAWWWLSGQLADERAQAQTAATNFYQYSKKEIFLPTRTNVSILQNNIDVMTQQLDPLVHTRLQSPKNGLKDVHSMDTVDWKHDLDDEVARLNTAATTHAVSVPPAPFYYGFSRYLNTNPAEEATAVLKRQELAIEAVSNILINAPVKGILQIKRTAEEDAPESGTSTTAPVTPRGQASDTLTGHSVEAPGQVYTAYPFQFEFDADSEALRTVINQIMQSDYVFVIRSMQVQNQKIESPKARDLDALAGTANAPSLVNSSPGAVASASAPTVGLQYLFGDETLHVRIDLDLIDWHGISQAPAASGGGATPHHRHNGGPGVTTNTPTLR